MSVYKLSDMKTGEQIYHELRSDILSLAYKPGQLISENAIAAHYQVSRSPIRGVFTRLANEKLLDVKPQKGTYVSLLDIEYIREIIYMRTIVEKDVLCQTARSITGELSRELAANLQQQKVLAARGRQADLSSYYKLDSAFHESCFRHIGRQRLWHILQDSQVHYHRFRMLDIVSQEILDKLWQQHDSIYQALCRQDEHQISQILQDHLQDGLNRIEKQVMTEHPEYFSFVKGASDMR
jgi:DNA-binding GntR family transcriptional regulator